MWNEKGYKRSFRWPQGVRLPIAVSVHHQSEEATCPMPGRPTRSVRLQRATVRRAARRLASARHHGQAWGPGTWLICGADAGEISGSVARRAASRPLHRRPHLRARDDVQYAAHSEIALIKKTVAVFEDLLGEHIHRMAHLLASHNTLDLLLEHSTSEWDGSMWNDDLPSLIEGHGREILKFRLRPTATQRSVSTSPIRHFRRAGSRPGTPIHPISCCAVSSLPSMLSTSAARSARS